MAIKHYYKTYDDMPEELGKGRLAEYPDVRADTLVADGDIEFGKAVQYKDNEPEVAQVFDGTGDGLAGIAMAKHFADYVDKDLVDMDTGEEDVIGNYDENDAVTVLREAIVWVEVNEEVSKGDGVCIDHVDGNFLPDDSSKTDRTEIMNAEFKSGAESGDLAKVEISLPSETELHSA